MTANAGLTVTCERCGTPFHVKPFRLKRACKTRFCSRACKAPDAAEFWRRVEIRGPDECWPWKGGRRVRDYGGMLFLGKVRIASRIAFFLTYGRWPHNARHTCDNPPCCNPAHVIEGTHADNMADAAKRGRLRRGEASKQSDLTEEKVRAIRRSPLSNKEAALVYGVDATNISRIRNRRTWGHVE